MIRAMRLEKEQLYKKFIYFFFAYTDRQDEVSPRPRQCQKIAQIHFIKQIFRPKWGELQGGLQHESNIERRKNSNRQSEHRQNVRFERGILSATAPLLASKEPECGGWQVMGLPQLRGMGAGNLLPFRTHHPAYRAAASGTWRD